jgi:hypothetical protein
MSIKVVLIFAACFVVAAIVHHIHRRKTNAPAKPTSLEDPSLLGCAMFAIAFFALLMSKGYEPAREEMRVQIREMTNNAFRLRIDAHVVPDPKKVVQEILTLDARSTFHQKMDPPIRVSLSDEANPDKTLTFWVRQCAAQPSKFDVVPDPKTHKHIGTFESIRLRDFLLQRVVDQQNE